MLVPVNDVASYGLINDKSSLRAPIGAWTDLKNVRFQDDYIQKAFGSRSLLIPSVAPYGIFFAPALSTKYWIYAGLEKVYGFLGSTQADITRVSSDYTATANDEWTGSVFSSIPILNNGVDIPQVWAPVSLAQKLVDLPDWPATALCSVMRPFKSYLVALDVTKSGVRDRRMVKWSHPADPGYLPTSWDETDATKDAGEKSLAEGIDALVDCMELGDANIIYGEASTWAQRHIGGEFIFDFHKLFNSSGILGRDCVKPFKEMHFVVTQDDIIIHDTARVESIADSRVKNWFFNNLNSSAYYLTKVIPFYKYREMWICFPKVGGVLDTALIWNWVSNTWSVRDLPLVRAVSSSLYSPVYSADQWDSGDSLQWDEESTQEWGSPEQNKHTETFMMAPPDTSGILVIDPTLREEAGVPYEGLLERTGLDVIGLNKDGNPAHDVFREKNVSSFWPIIDAPAGTVFSISIGTQENLRDDVTWSAASSFTVGMDVKVDIYVTGRYYGFRIQETVSVDWKLLGYHFDVEAAGRL